MVAEAAALGGAAAALGGTHAVWDYNRENFKYDREMRQEQEFQILEYRTKQAEQWREDVRDLIGLTEKKMDLYTVPTTIQLGMCVVLFVEGRLEPGTPQWLLRMYMLSLGGAFMYLLMAVWLAMHASVVAQSSSTRLLTQLVRLPVPSWDQIEAVRTYAASYENLEVKQMLRVPFVQRPEVPGSDSPSKIRSAAAAAVPPGGGAAPPASDGAPGQLAGVEGKTVDPWGQELDGGDIYELQQQPTAVLRHVDLVRRAAQHYQCYDAFARVAMTLGTNQLLFAISYYALGYLIVQDGAPWAGLCVVLVMVSVAATLVQMDISLTRGEQMTAQVLIVSGPSFASFAVTVQCMYTDQGEFAASCVVPFVAAVQGLWLAWALNACDVQKQPSGAFLPTKFRTVLYLDVFGWLFRRGGKACRRATDGDVKDDPNPGGVDPHLAGQRGGAAADSLREELSQELALWETVGRRGLLSDADRRKVERLRSRLHAPAGDRAPRSLPDRWLRLYNDADTGTQVPYIYDVANAARIEMDVEAQARAGRPEPLELSETKRRVEQLLQGPRQDAGEARAAPPGRGGAAAPARLGGGGGSARTIREAHRSGLSFPRHFDKIDGRRVRPEDIDRYHAEAVHEAAHAYLVEEMERDPTRGSAVQGVGNAAAVPDAHEDFFHPVTFYPQGTKRASDRHVGEEDKVVTGHDKLRPGEAPWKIFRVATNMLVTCWALSGVLSVPPVKDRLGIHTKPLPEIMEKYFGEEAAQSAAMGVDLVDSPAYGMPGKGTGKSGGVEHQDAPRRGAPDLRRLQELPGGEHIQAEWPSHFSFVPKVLGTDASGRRLVVADDFGVYSAWLRDDPPATWAARVGAGADALAAPGPSAAGAAAESRRLEDEAARRGPAGASFRREPPCVALEGQALRDISLVCGGGGGAGACSLLGLLQGSRIAECPLSAEGPLGAGGPGEVSEGGLWNVSDGWMNGTQEQLLSVAVDHGCGDEGLRPPGRGGCVLVGTSRGRVVQLRRHTEGQGRLVPDWAFQQEESAGPGQIHALPGGGVVLSLLPGRGVLRAVDSLEGAEVAEWRLPQDVAWTALGGGGDGHLYLLGRARRGRRRNARSRASLWRFPVPPELSALAQRARQAEVDDRQEI